MNQRVCKRNDAEPSLESVAAGRARAGRLRHNETVARVTVFIPTCNRAGLLGGAIASILAQTFTDFQLLVSDNASEDETPQVVESLDDPRLTYVRQPENLGLLGNHNWFLDRVETEYSLILPDDDRLYPKLLERTVAELDRQPRAGMVHTSFDVIGSRDEVLLPDVNWRYAPSSDAVESADEFMTESMKWSCRVCASTALMRTGALPPGGMAAEDFPAVDFGMWLRMAAAGWEFAFLGETLGAYRIHGATHSAAFGAPHGPGYIQGPEIVSRLKEVKLQFLAQYNGELPHPRRLRRLASQARRRELVVMARNTTLPERGRRSTFRALARAAGVDPGVLIRPDAWKLAGASLVGPRLVERLKARRETQGR
jgi:glycosyltransferase involved in cell wall biosynthesis